MPKQSAGLLLYTLRDDAPWLLIVHPSGAYNARAPWSLPKGEPEPGETLEAAARRETREETGIDVTGPVEALGYVDYRKSSKRVFAWSAPLPAGAAPRPASWEVDRVELRPADEARALLHEDLCPFVDRLLARR